MSLSEPVYIDLVKEFYSNLVFSEGVLKSTIKDVQIILSTPRLGRLLQIPCEGSYLDELSKKEVGLRTILGRNDVKVLLKIEAKDLSVEMRLLHHMVSRSFFLKGEDMI